MDADDVQSATPLRATRVHARMVYANGSTKNSVTSSISQRFPPTEITYNPAQSPHKSPHITVDTSVHKLQHHHISPVQKSSPSAPSCGPQIEGSMMTSDWLDNKSLLSPSASPHSPTQHRVVSDFFNIVPASPSATNRSIPHSLPVPSSLMRSISSQTSSSAPYYGRTSIDTNLADTQSAMLYSRERSNHDMPNAHVIATSIPLSSKSTPTDRRDQKRQVVQNNKQFMQMSDAEAHVQKGIRYHEGGQLEKATQHFRAAADRDSPMGMFLYGISLRHGWGCRANTQLAFQYLQKAAEHAVDDLNNLSTVNLSAAKGELVMAIYELGVSFRHGWGVQKDKKTACYYFKIAAELGDPDAQNDVAHCYYHGQGVKRDVYQAAKYYRLAAAQGEGIMGNSWIFKKKYDQK
ncbi:hypothetical protein Unana1_00885 [Umbelopsis nana]